MHLDVEYYWDTRVRLASSLFPESVEPEQGVSFPEEESGLLCRARRRVRGEPRVASRVVFCRCPASAGVLSNTSWVPRECSSKVLAQGGGSRYRGDDDGGRPREGSGN